MPSLGSPWEAIPTRRNRHSQDPDALISSRRDIAHGPTPTDLDSPFQTCRSPVEEWSLSPWASKCIISLRSVADRSACDLGDSTQGAPGCEHFDSELVTMDINSESATTRLTKPSFDSSATHMAKSFKLGLQSPFHWQYDESNFSNLHGLSTNYRPESCYSKPAAPHSDSGFGNPKTPYSAPKPPEESHSYDLLSWKSLETSPFPAQNSGPSFSDRSMAISRTQKSSRAMHAIVNMGSCDSYRSALNTPFSVGEDIFGGSIHWQSPISPGHDKYLNSQTRSKCSSKAIAFSSSLELPETSTVIKATERNNYYFPPDNPSVPNLLASFHGPSLTPPPPSPSDSPSLTVLQQCPRFSGDLYTPTFVRKEGKAREGWCGLCRPGRWLVLKNSAFWYDKSFIHGISAASGQAWDGPSQTQFGRKTEVWEGLCGTCGQWIILTASKSGGVSWYRHAYKVSFLGWVL